MLNVEHEKPKILGVGITGLVGSRIVELLGDKYTFVNLSLETGVDITNPQTLEIIKPDWEGIILHLAAKADVDGCEKDKILGENGDAWRINVEGIRNVVETCKQDGKKIVYISTDFIYDGQRTPGDGYDEEDSPHPINWYGKTKLKGEEIVQSSGLPFLIIRIAYPYRAEFPEKRDFVRAILERLEKGEKISAVKNHIMTPTFIDDITWAFNRLLEEGATGIYHVVGSQFISPYDAARLIAQVFDFNQSLITPVTREDYFRDRVPRPFNLSLKNNKIRKLGIKMRTFQEGLEEIKRQLPVSN